ncbi:hypothetical protein [Fimbriiglobus ruber]|uniref:Uncharacterized protein n=1 Tax=Fimbriiglobus ruber TaxID=1908690 RepID=A0A225DV17_9BACT|nr:hypothetical protein [Fimbriiglobus ruber]OWK40999.1 hypothetical protein FRUB_04891 [Fimbriiglobus ruber]
MNSILFADLDSFLGWTCFVFLALLGGVFYAIGQAGQAVASLFESDTAKEVAGDVASEVARSWLASWLDDLSD